MRFRSTRAWLTRRVRIDVVWLNRTWPIKRRWRLRVAGRIVLSVPLTTVEWSRNRRPEDL